MYIYLYIIFILYLIDFIVFRYIFFVKKHFYEFDLEYILLSEISWPSMGLIIIDYYRFMFSYISFFNTKIYFINIILKTLISDIYN